MRLSFLIGALALWSNTALAVVAPFQVIYIRNTTNNYDFLVPSQRLPIGPKEHQVTTYSMMFAAKAAAESFDFYLCPTPNFALEICKKVNQNSVSIHSLEQLVQSGIGLRPNDLLGAYSAWGNSLPITRSFLRQHGQEFLKTLKANGALEPIGPVQTWSEYGHKLLIAQLIYYSGARPTDFRK